MDPLDPRKGPEKRHLPLRVATRIEDDRLLDGFDIAAAEELAVPDRRHAGCVRAVAACRQGREFSGESGCHHGLDTKRDALVQLLAGSSDSEHQEPIAFASGGGRSEVRRGTAAGAQDFHRPGQAVQVERGDARCRDRIDRGQFRPQGIGALALQVGRHGGAQPRIGRGAGRKPAHEIAQVKTGAARNHGQAAPRGDSGAGLVGSVHEIPRGVLLARVQDIDQVVRQPFAKGAFGLGRTDVHAAIRLHGIGADDFGATGETAGKRGSSPTEQPVEELRLARRGRACDDDDVSSA